LTEEDLRQILMDKKLAQFGDSLLNFAYSLALTQKSGRPRGLKIQDRILAEASVKSGLRKHMPRRVDRGDVANGFEALLAFAWLEKRISLDEIVECLKIETMSPSENFAQLAEIAVSRIAK